MNKTVFSLMLLSSAQAIASDAPNMIETTTSGIQHRYEGGWEFYVGGGIAAFDCNNDQYPELYLAGGSSPAQLYINQSSRGGDIKFSKASDQNLNLQDVTGAYPLDVNGDGLMDLAILRVGENALYKGLGNCRFERANEEWNFISQNNWSTAFSATWEQGESWPTLATGNYVDRSQPGQPWGTCHDNFLYRPQAESGKFAAATPLTPSFCTLSMLFSDWNRSGEPSLRVANDRQYYKQGQEQLWKVSKGKKPSLYSSRDGWRKLKIWGMGIASYDLTNDGYPEYYLTSMGDNKLRTLAKGPTKAAYTDLAHQVGLTAHRPFVGGEVTPSTGWHAQFEDFNNDTFVDLYITKGNVHSMSDFAQKDPNNLLLGQYDGSFKEAADKAGLITLKQSRGAAVADLNLDGMLDVVVNNREADTQVWKNTGFGDAQKPVPMGNWVALKVQQNNSNRNAVGAWIELRAGEKVQRKEISIGGGHAGGSALWHHFGVGVAERVTVRIQWPDGEWGPWIRLYANQFVRIERGRETPAIWQASFKASKGS
jgi:enediyne biosynthesis protein E4